MYRDFFKQYNGKFVNGVQIRMQLVLKRFFHSGLEIADLVRSFRFPCLWNANFFIAADGSSICCNDQSVRNPQGNILTDSIETLMQYKEQFLPEKVCARCNQSPQNLKGSFLVRFFSVLARLRLQIAKIFRENIEKLSTLKTVANSQKEIGDYLAQQAVLFEKLVSDIKDEKLSLGSSLDELIGTYGEPIISKKGFPDAAGLVLLYRAPRRYFDSDKVYLHFDGKKELIFWEYKPHRKPN